VICRVQFETVVAGKLSALGIDLEMCAIPGRCLASLKRE
jgi:hypothetical protein